MEQDERGGISDQEWENRVLCSDESCIGVIGPDGRCKECGLPYKGKLPETFPEGPTSEVNQTQDETLTDNTGDNDASDETAEGNESTDLDDEWARRKLCVDEGCIGVIGPDGRCKECGKPG